jgi:hypothetical protein
MIRAGRVINTLWCNVINSDYLILIECVSCGHEQYFEIDSLPGGDEHCPYCEECCSLLPQCTITLGRTDRSHREDLKT